MKKHNEDFELVDRRLYPRFKVHYLADVYLGNRNIYATVVDISEKGVGIILPERFYPGDEIELRIRCCIEGGDEKKTDVRLSARVVWIGEKNEKGIYTGGLEIVDISEVDLDILRLNIAQLAEDQPET
ncbi:MAG: PilZ domain-containing protein [Candidatus Aureabacteria bacterium]|nr:PilZ domain-containing protein [Candidatus Auribacterota bacterium]